jgi:methylmalonyl-CoA mutase
MPDPELSLAADFPPSTRDDWEALVRAVLKGEAFDRLITTTVDGLHIEPLYAQHARAMPIGQGKPGVPWTVMQRLDFPEPQTASAEAVHELANGATALSLVFCGAPTAYGYGLPASEQSITRAQEHVQLDAGIVVDVDAGRHASDAAAAIAAMVKNAGFSPAATNIRFGFDPIGAAAVEGGAALPWNALAGPFAAEISGIALDAARNMILFRLTADADQFLTMAKLRALRKLWARVEAVCGLSPAALLLAADTAWRMMTKRDPYVNMVRACIAVASAGLAGADAITALPFTMAIGLPDRFARRIARNTQLILIEEAHVGKVMDPAAGAGAIENMTDQLCQKAWVLFQEIEQVGGAWAALQRGDIQKKIAATRARRQEEVATRKAALTGTSDFPNLGEAPVGVMANCAATAEVVQKVVQFEPMASFRLAEPFEELRDRSDQILANTGTRPKVFLAKLGTASDFTARASFAKNVFEAGGFETDDYNAGDSNAALSRAFAQSGARLVCLCSSDAVYTRDGAAAVRAVAQAGGAVWLTGKPERPLQAAGASAFIYPGCNVLGALRNAYSVITGEA